MQTSPAVIKDGRCERSTPNHRDGHTAGAVREYSELLGEKPFTAGNTGSSPVGDANFIKQLQIPSRILYVL
jgi:hypothetical protein